MPRRGVASASLPSGDRFAQGLFAGRSSGPSRLQTRFCAKKCFSDPRSCFANRLSRGGLFNARGPDQASVAVGLAVGAPGDLPGRIARCGSARRCGTLNVMRPLRYSINITLDGCCDYRAIVPDEDLHRHAVENFARADALLFGRVTYEIMEAAWRQPAQAKAWPGWMEPFARTIDAAKKYVVSNTLDRVDWNAELVRGDLEKAVQRLKRQSGKGLFVGGVKLPLALAELGLIDEYEFVVQPRLAGRGPTLFAGLSRRIDLRLLSRIEFGSGAVAMRYEPIR